MVRENCAFCPSPEPITKWWHEDNVCRIINTPSQSPMVVLNRHAMTPSESERQHIDEIVTDYYGAHSLCTLMHDVEEHWHSHIREYEQEPTVPIVTPSENTHGDNV